MTLRDMVAPGCGQRLGGDNGRPRQGAALGGEASAWARSPADAVAAARP
jgi:hypothetical protein